MLDNLRFRLMALEFRLRDLLEPPQRVLIRVGVRQGMTVLDFGCGTGGFSFAAARLVGREGRVVAVDIHPLAIQRVERAAGRRGLRHLQVLRADAMSRWPSGSVDIALLFDVLHEIDDRAAALAEIRRVLKPDGVLAAKDHCIKGAALVESVSGGGLFRLLDEGGLPLRFAPAKAGVTRP